MADKSIHIWRTIHPPRKMVNAIYFDPNDKPTVKPFCSLCGVYHIYIKNKGFECPKCGDEYVDKSTDDGELQNKYTAEPMIGISKRKKKRNRADFPPGAQITSDVETSSEDGSETDLILDDADVLRIRNNSDSSLIDNPSDSIHVTN